MKVLKLLRNGRDLVAIERAGGFTAIEPESFLYAHSTDLDSAVERLLTILPPQVKRVEEVDVEEVDDMEEATPAKERSKPAKPKISRR